jgi:predicted peroxiredoxin
MKAPEKASFKKTASEEFADDTGWPLPINSGFPDVTLPLLDRSAWLWQGNGVRGKDMRMAKFLVHVHTGPADPNKATLGCLIAAKAAEEGHDVTLFLAGDGTHLMAPEHRAALVGLGTGRLGDHIDAFAEAGGRILVSGLSARARGYDDDLLDGYPAEFALPQALVSLAVEADTVLCY